MQCSMILEAWDFTVFADVSIKRFLFLCWSAWIFKYSMLLLYWTEEILISV